MRTPATLLTLLSSLLLGTLSPSWGAYAIDMSGPAPVLPGHGADGVSPVLNGPAPQSASSQARDSLEHHHAAQNQIVSGVAVFVPNNYSAPDAPVPDLTRHTLAQINEALSTQNSMLDNELSLGQITLSQFQREVDALDAIEQTAQHDEFVNGGFVTGDQQTDLLSQIDRIHQWIVANLDS